MKELLMVSGILGFSNIFALIAAIIRNKLMAVNFGAYGLGIYAQAAAFLALMSVLGSMGIVTAAAKYIPEYYSNGQTRKAMGIIAASVGLILFLSSIIFIIVAFPGHRYLSRLIFNSGYGKFWIIFLAAAIPFQALVFLWSGIYNGFRAYKAYVKANIIGISCGLIILIVSMRLWGIAGIILYFLLGSASSFFIYLFFSFYELAKGAGLSVIKGIIFRGFGVSVAKNLLLYGATVIFSSLFLYLVSFITRIIINRQLGIEANGLYQSSYGFTQQYLSIFQGIIMAYLLPKLNTIGENSAIQREVDNATRFSLILIVPAAFLAIFLRGIILGLFYSEKFIAAKALFPYQAAGDFIIMLGCSMGFFFLAKGYKFKFLLISAVYPLVSVSLCPVLINFMGLPGVPAAFLLGGVMQVGLIYFFYSRKLKLAISPRTKSLILLSAFTIFISVLLSENTSINMAVKLAIFIFWLRKMFRMQDWRKLIQLLKGVKISGLNSN